LKKYQKLKSGVTTLKDCTIIVLSKNHEKFISDCLTSIHRELYDVKILCADIGSIDDSFNLGQKICKNLEMQSTHIKLHPKTKTLTALKSLEKYVSTNYVILLSADDAFGTKYREALIKLLKDNSKYCVINFPLLYTDENLKPLHLKIPKWTGSFKENRKRLSYSNPGTAPGAVIPWRILINSDSWKQPPNIVIEDYWIWWQLITLVPFVSSQESHVLYRQHPHNISRASKNIDYAYSLGYVSALPNDKTNSFQNRLLSFGLIPRWLRHLNITVWRSYLSGYQEYKRSELFL
jgi:glycosyltransferase involved in cell wall biosynthesis